MKPKFHALLGFILATLLYLFFPQVDLLWAILIFISSFAIDFDYYLYYWWKTGNLSLLGTYKFARKRKEKYCSLSESKRNKSFRAYRIFHGVEILILLLALGRYTWSGFYAILIGASLHLILDWVCDAISNVRQDRISVVWSFMRLKKLKEI